MFKPKQKHGLIMLMCIAVVVFGLVVTANAYKRPANATMDYVPQNEGVYDTYYCNFKESDCRYCHGTTTAWRHHATELAVRGQCDVCHDLVHNPYTDPERDCKACHIDGTWVQVDIGYGVGNLGNPHHKGNLAEAWRCTGCHSAELVSDPNTHYVPQFDPTDITPTPFSCENCHWPSGSVAHEAALYNGDTSATTGFLADWNLWVPGWGPKPTTWGGVLAPAPIEANGPVSTGDVVASDPDPDANKPYRPTGGTHHEIDGAIVQGRCNTCHATSPGGAYMIDETNPLLIRGCENCHDIYTLHKEPPRVKGIAEHTTDGIGGSSLGGYTVGNTLDQIVIKNMKCVACHGDVVTSPMPADPMTSPVIASIEPPMASAGVTISLYAGSPDFGSQGDDDTVEILGSGQIVPEPCGVVSWNPDKIECVVPGDASVNTGVATVSVIKKYWVEDLGDSIGNEDSICDPGEACHQNSYSANTNFYVRQHPILNALTPDHGTWNTTITISAQPDSFYSARENFYDGGLTSCDPGEQCYGYSTYVEFVASNDNYRVTSMSGSGWTGDAGLTAWAHNSIDIRLDQITVGGIIYGNMLDLNNSPMTPVALADLYKGPWMVYVITDYFKANAVNPGTMPAYLKHQGGSPTGHLTGKINTTDYTLQYREISDPLAWYATDTPFISSLAPLAVKGGNLFAIYGTNFGTTQDTSYVKAGSCVTNPATWHYVFPGTPPSAQVYQWSNTRIVLRAPTVGTSKTGCLQVIVPKVQAPADDFSNISDSITVYP